MRSITLTFLGFLAVQTAFAQADFKDAVKLPLLGESTTAKFGDVDGDGDNDVVFTSGSGLYVAYNDNTVFNRVETVSAPWIAQFEGDPNNHGVSAFVIHDFNHDNLQDIVAVNYKAYKTDHIAVYSLVGRRFEPIVTIQVREPDVFATTVFCGDMNKDGSDDIILTPNLDGEFFMEIESSTQPESGGFIEKKIATPGTTPQRSWMEDINNDGNLDIIFTTNSPKISIYKNNDAGEFTFDKDLVSDETVFDVAIADFNGDQKKDIVALSGVDPGTFDYYVQGSNGFFIKTNIPHEFETIFSLDAGDVDKDNDIDFFYDGKYTDLVLMINNGNGVFEEKSINIHNDHDSYYNVMLGDIDGDTFPEILPSCYKPQVEIFKKNGSEYASHAIFELPDDTADTGKMSDLNNDGREDLILTYKGSKTISVAYNSGESNWFERPYLYQLRIKPTLVRSLRVNNDQLNDIIFTTVVEDSEAEFGYTGHLDGLLTDDNGQLQLAEDLDADGHFSSNYLETGDFNNDGVDDLQAWFFTLFKNGEGKFDWVQAPTIPISISSQAVADFNNDGFEDVVMSTEYSNILDIEDGILVRWGQAQNVLATGPTQQMETGPHQMTVANLNKDEFPDLVCHDFYGNVMLLVGNGDGTFVVTTPNIDIINWFNDGKSYFVMDVDHDGDDDLGITTFNETLDIYLNDGTGVLTKNKSVAMPDPLPYTIVSGKIDGDDLEDIILLPDDGAPRILINDFVPEPTVPSDVVVLEWNSFSAEIFFEGGNGDSRLLILREGVATNAVPVDNTFYIANPEMTKGAKLGANNYVVFDGSENSVVVTNLKPNTTYFFTLFESDRNERGTIVNYLTSTSTSGSFTTKQDQTITFFVEDKVEGDPDFLLEATTNSGLPITYEVTAGNVTLDKDTITIVGPGSVTIVATQEGSDEVEPATSEVTFCVRPMKPSITVDSLTLTSSSATNNTWYLDGSVIEGATEQTYVATVEGSYTVHVSYDECWTESDPVEIEIITGLGDMRSRIDVSPNPATNKLLIKINASELNGVQPVVIDMTGRAYHLQSVNRPDGIELNIEGLTAGLYVLRVGSGASFKFQKE